MTKIPKLIKNVRTNGHITQNILHHALMPTNDADTVRRRVASLLDSFPLSSFKMVYDDTLATIREGRGEDIEQVVLSACVESDKRKLKGVNLMNAEYGVKLDTEFGRYTEVAK